MHYIGLLALIIIWVVGICLIAIIIQGTIKAMKKNTVSEKQAFNKISERYPATPKQIENILDRHFSFPNKMMEIFRDE